MLLCIPLHRGTTTEGYRSVGEHLTIMDKALGSIPVSKGRLVHEQTKYIFLWAFNNKKLKDPLNSLHLYIKEGDAAVYFLPCQYDILSIKLFTADTIMTI